MTIMCNNDNNTFLAREELTGRYFYTNTTLVNRAASEANEIMLLDGDVDLNTFYDRLGLEKIALGNDLGWSGQPVSIDFGAALAGISAPCGFEGLPILTIAFRNDPKPALGTR